MRRRADRSAAGSVTERTVAFPDRVLHYLHEIKDVKNINIRIRPDMSVYVSSNARTKISEVEKVLIDKRAFICAALDRYAETGKHALKEHKYVSGERFRFLGRELILKVAHGEINGAETDGEYLYLTVKTDTEELKRRLIRRWYERTCESKIMSICKNTFVLFERYDLSFPEIRFRYMVSCWGNCRPRQNVLTFNKRLIEAPETCVEYVVMHEFIHFLQADHSKRFYALLTKFMPDWKERVRLLKKQGISANRI